MARSYKRLKNHKPKQDREKKRLRKKMDEERRLKVPCGKCLACKMGFASILCEGLT